MKPTWLLIDLDGTLLKSDRLSTWTSFFTRVIQEMRPRIGLLKSLRALYVVHHSLRYASDPTDPTLNIDRMIRHLSQHLSLTECDSRLLYASAMDNVFPQLKSHFTAVRTGVDFVSWAKSQKRYRLVLATNPVWRQKEIELRLGWTGLATTDFEWITHAENMSTTKPNTEYYRAILDHIQARADDCIMIGNSKSEDAPASHIGIRTMILSNDNPFLPVTLKGHPVLMGSFTAIREWLSKEYINQKDATR